VKAAEYVHTPLHFRAVRSRSRLEALNGMDAAALHPAVDRKLIAR
jgi:hypothetical protein